MSRQTYQSLFNYGETGFALDGFRDSEISKQSANKIVNFAISDMGTLQVAKRYLRYQVLGSRELSDGTKVEEEVLGIKITKYDFYIALTCHGIYTIRKKEVGGKYEPLYYIGYKDNTKHGYYFDEYCNANIFQNFLFVKLKDGTPLVYNFGEDGRIAQIDYFSQLKLPYKSSKPVVVELYKVYKKTIGEKSELIPNFMLAYNNNLELKIQPNGDIFLAGSNEKISRIYLSYKTSITNEMIDGLSENMLFCVMRHTYEANKAQSKGYYIDEKYVEFGERKRDNKYNGEYIEKMTVPKTSNVVTGKITFGDKDDFIDNRKDIIDICDFQSRVCIATREKLYFSKMFDATDFSTGLEQDAGLFIQPATIEGNQGDIMKLVSGNGIYVLSSEGIYVCNYGQALTYASQSMRVASTNRPLPCCVLIDDVLYYLDRTGILRGLIPTFQNGIVQFVNNIVDKYSNAKFDYSYLSKTTLNNRNVLVVTLRDTKINDEMIIYEYIGENMFRRTTLMWETKNSIIHGIGSDLFIGNQFHKLTNFNMPNARLILNMPFLQTSIGGVYLNDYLQEYSQIVLNVLNIDNKYIKGISINGHPIQNIGYKMNNYNIYKFTGTMGIMELTIDIQLNETGKMNGVRGDDTVELRGVNCFLK